MKITKPMALVASVVVIAGIGAGVALWTPKAAPHTPESAQATAQTSKTTSLGYSGQDGKTALELLKAAAAVTTKDSSYGAYVDSINGVAGGANGKYWTFYVNGAMSQEGAETYNTKTGDRIEWKLQ